MPPILADTVAEIERHVAESGWDQPPRLYALADTEQLLAREPQLAATLGIRPGEAAVDSLTPVEQDDLPDEEVDELLGRIAWPSDVLGVALVQEVLVLPPEAEAARETGAGGSGIATAADANSSTSGQDDTDGHAAVTAWAAAHPQRQEVRLAVGVLRAGARAAALRVRGQEEVVTGPDLVPGLAEALSATLRA